MINLAKDRGRWAQIQKQLRAARVKYSRIEGVDGSRPGPDSRVTGECRRFCTPGVVGCALSHRKAWETVAARSDPEEAHLVLEDDAEIPPDLADQWGSIAGSVPPDADLVHLHGADLLPLGSSRITERLVRPGWPLAMHAYVLTPRGARNLLKQFPAARYHVDFQLAADGALGYVRAYSVSPTLVSQAGLDSNLSSLRYPLLAAGPADSFGARYVAGVPLGRVGPLRFDPGVLLSFLAGLWAPMRLPWTAFLLVNLAVAGGSRPILEDLAWVAAGWAVRRA